MARFRSGRTQRSAVIIGAGELERKFLALEQEAQAHAMLKAVEAGADVLEPAMRGRAPRGESGDLAASVETRSFVRRRQAQADVGPTVTYAPHVELGHKTPNGKHVPAQPFMRQSLASARSAIVAAVAAVVKARIARLTRGAG